MHPRGATFSPAQNYLSVRTKLGIVGLLSTPPFVTLAVQHADRSSAVRDGSSIPGSAVSDRGRRRETRGPSVGVGDLLVAGGKPSREAGLSLPYRCWSLSCIPPATTVKALFGGIDTSAQTNRSVLFAERAYLFEQQSACGGFG